MASFHPVESAFETYMTVGQPFPWQDRSAQPRTPARAAPEALPECLSGRVQNRSTGLRPRVPPSLRHAAQLLIPRRQMYDRDSAVRILFLGTEANQLSQSVFRSVVAGF